MNDLISRKWLMECVNEGWIKFDTEKDKNIYVHLVRDIAPSARPEYRLDEWCTDCKEYDTEKHCCPRFNQVIRTTLNEMKSERKKGKWIVHDYALGRERYECAECKGRCDLGYNFCPHCGADMSGGQDE